MKKALFLLCLLRLTPPVQAQGKLTLDQVFANLDSVSKTFQTAQADIERTHVTVIVNDKDVSSGKFFYTRVGKEPRVKLELTKPAGQEQYLLIDKGKIQIYQPNLKRVQEASISGHQDQVEMFMALGFGQSSQELTKNFDVSLGGEEVLDGKKAVILDLVPKNKASFKAVRMWFDPIRWLALQLKATENSNDYMIFKYSDIRTNGLKSFGDVFDLKLPKDVKIMKL